MNVDEQDDHENVKNKTKMHTGKIEKIKSSHTYKEINIRFDKEVYNKHQNKEIQHKIPLTSGRRNNFLKSENKAEFLHTMGKSASPTARLKVGPGSGSL